MYKGLKEKLFIDPDISVIIGLMKASNKKYFKNIVHEYIKDKYENKINKYCYSFKKSLNFEYKNMCH